MKRGYIVTLVIAVALLVPATMVLPSYFAKQGLDRLAASLPAGTRFTYGDASYSLFSRSLLLKNAVLHVADPAADIDIEQVEVQDGNPGLDSAVAKAEAAPSLDATEETQVAGHLRLSGVHTVYGPLDLRMAAVEIDNPRLVLPALFAPLPALQHSQAAGGTMDGLDANSDLRGIMQRGARVSLATSYDRLEVTGLDLTATDHVSNESARVHIGQTFADSVVQGSAKSGALNDLSVVAQDVTFTIGSLRGEVGDQRPFLLDLRQGLPVSAAFTHYPSVQETIANIAVKRGNDTVVTVDQTDFSNVRYDNGIPVSLDLTIKAMKVDPALLPDAGTRSVLTALGYKPAVFDFKTSYRLDVARQQLTVSGTVLTLQQGGTLTLDVVANGVAPGAAPMGVKVASATMTYQDGSLFTRWVDYVAKLTGKDATAVKSDYIARLEMMKPNFKADPPLSAAIDAAEKFVANPYGMTLTVKPALPIGLADFDVSHPEGFTNKLGLVVTATAAPVVPPPAKP